MHFGPGNIMDHLNRFLRWADNMDWKFGPAYCLPGSPIWPRLKSHNLWELDVLTSDSRPKMGIGKLTSTYPYILSLSWKQCVKRIKIFLISTYLRLRGYNICQGFNTTFLFCMIPKDDLIPLCMISKDLWWHLPCTSHPL